MVVHFAVYLHAVVINIAGGGMANFHYGFAGGGFAAARFANEGERFFVYIEAHVLNRAELLAVQLEVDVKIAHGHKLFAV